MISRCALTPSLVIFGVAYCGRDKIDFSEETPFFRIK